MQRVFTDHRFPGIHIENHGTFSFFVVQGGKTIETFIAKENLNDRHVSEEFARRRAEDFFERMSRMDMSAELDAQNWGKPDQVTPLRQVHPQEVERALAAARAEQDPKRRQELEQRALRLMAREESLVQQLVNSLLHER